MGTVSLDTQICIWAIRGGGNPSQREEVRRSRILLDQLEDESATIIIPSVVVAELLVPVDVAKHGEFLIELQKRFVTAPVDLQAASLAASIWQQHKNLKKSDQTKRTILKADALIVASAQCAGARRFYSHDKGCRHLARLIGMEPRDLPTHDENLFRGA